jgi:hypothetical protein
VVTPEAYFSASELQGAKIRWSPASGSPAKHRLALVTPERVFVSLHPVTSLSPKPGPWDGTWVALEPHLSQPWLVSSPRVGEGDYYMASPVLGEITPYKVFAANSTVQLLARLNGRTEDPRTLAPVDQQHWITITYMIWLMAYTWPEWAVIAFPGEQIAEMPPTLTPTTLAVWNKNSTIAEA